MSVANQAQLYLQALLYYMNKNVTLTPPSSFEGKVQACQGMLNHDVTGLVSTIVDFAVDAVSEVKFTIETDNDKLTDILNGWLSSINVELKKYVATGFNSIVKDYVRESFTSGLMLTKYEMDEFDTLKLPMKLWVANSAKITSKNDDIKDLDFEYLLENEEIDGDFFLRKDCKMTQALPTPFLIKRGVWANYQLKKTIKENSNDILKELIWYLFIFKQGDPAKTKYKQPDYENIAGKLKKTIEEAKESTAERKTPSYVGDLDTQAEHILPDLQKIFTTVIYEEIDRDILAGLGLIDIVQGISSTRKESVLNPKPLVQKITSIIIDIEKLLLDLIREIVAQNRDIHPKYFSQLKNVRIVRTPLKAFWTQEFKDMIRSLYDRGLLSYKTTLESVDFDLETELKRKEKELSNGNAIIFYPPVIRNMEGEGDETPFEIKQQDLVDDEEVDDDKKGIEKENYYMSTKLEQAPYQKPAQLPPNIRKALSPAVARLFIKTFNAVYKTYIEDYDKDLAETIARKTAWSAVKSKARKNKKGIWTLKKTTIKPKEK